MTWASRDAAKVNPALNTVARVVNMYTNAGVPLDHLKFVAIAYGPATPIALDNARYKKEFSVDNPNLPLVRDLRRHGIDVAVCGQAVFQHHYQDDWVDRNVTLALSAMTTITELEDEGYALAPL